MKPISRRKFGSILGAAAIAAPAAARAQQPKKRPPPPPPLPPAAEPQVAPAEPKEAAAAKYGMTKQQEEAVKQAIERAERGRASIRSYPLEYSDEPAFVFQAKAGKESGRRR